MSTIYCDLNKNVSNHDINECLKKYYSNSDFVKLINKAERN